MSERYTAHHDGFRGNLLPQAPVLSLSRSLFLLVLGSAGLLWWRPTGEALIAGFVALLLFGIFGVYRSFTRPQREIVISCDHRELHVVEQRGARVLSRRTLSLLDLAKAGANPEGWLVLEPRPGPLLAIVLDARGTRRSHLEKMASSVNEAIAHADRFRGDHPDASTHAVHRLLDGREHA